MQGTDHGQSKPRPGCSQTSRQGNDTQQNPHTGQQGKGRTGDDVVKFVKREIRRGNKYDAIIMDPPSFGRGSNGEVWNIEESLYPLIKLCMEVLSDNPLFFLINSYTTGMSPKVLENILYMTLDKKYKGKISSGEVGLPMKDSNLILPCGIYGLWESSEDK